MEDAHDDLQQQQQQQQDLNDDDDDDDEAEFVRRLQEEQEEQARILEEDLPVILGDPHGLQMPFDSDSEEEEEEEEDGEDLPLHFIGVPAVSEDEEEGDDDDDDDDDSFVQITRYVSCDECGKGELTGRYYHSTRIVDYDICQECYEENHKNLTMADAFVEMNERSVLNEAQYFGEDHHEKRVDAHTWLALENLLEEDRQRETSKVQNIDLDLSQYPSLQPLDAESRKNMRDLIASSTTLKVFYVILPSTHQDLYTEEVQALFQGIAASNSITTLSVDMDFQWESAARNLCDLIRTNKSIRYLILRYRRHKFTEEEWQRHRQEETRNQLCREIETRVRAATVQFFQALEDTSLQSFLCLGVTRLGEDCRTAAIQALRNRPSLKRIQAKFQNTTDTTLQDLMDEKQYHWIRGWNDPGATNRSRVQILEEILSCKQVDQQDQVAALFHFIRSNPGALPLAPPEGEDRPPKRTRLA